MEHSHNTCLKLMPQPEKRLHWKKRNCYQRT